MKKTAYRKTLQTAVATALLVSTLIFASGCKSTPKEGIDAIVEKARDGIETLVPDTEESTTKKIPHVDFEGRGLKFEVEEMYLEGFNLMDDANASREKAAILLGKDSYAQLRVTFPTGIYECMICERSHSYDKTSLSLYLDNIQYDTNISNPPTSKWELTSSTPVTFTVPEPRTITIQIKAGKNKPSGSDSFGMYLDYIQFVKLDEN